MARTKDNVALNQYYGELTWSNFLDWLVTLCAGVILMMTLASLGGVRPDTGLKFLPLYPVLMVLHGLWFMSQRGKDRKLSRVPLLFLPFLLWMALHVVWLSPTAWLGARELSIGLQCYVLFWVLCNHAWSWWHRGVLFMMILVAVLYGVYIGYAQYFQDPGRIVSTNTETQVLLSAEYADQATGLFADPHSFAVLLLSVLPGILILATVKRLNLVARLFAYYLGFMVFLLVILTQCVWAVFLIIPTFLIVAWLSHGTVSQRVKRGLLKAGVALVLFGAMVYSSARLQQGFADGLTLDGEWVRFDIWRSALGLVKEYFVLGGGAGSFPVRIAQDASLTLPRPLGNPLNEYILLLSEYGLVGVVLLLGPILWIMVNGYQSIQAQPFYVQTHRRGHRFMPRQRIALTMTWATCFIFLCCGLLNYVSVVPGLLLVFCASLGALVQLSVEPKLRYPTYTFSSFAYLGLIGLLAVSGYFYVQRNLQSHAIELNASEQLDELAKKQIHISGNSDLLDEIIEDLERAIEIYPANVDALLSLSAANYQLYFRDPGRADEVGRRSSEIAQAAIALSPEYWKAWAQYGLAEALRGNRESASMAFETMLKFGTSQANAHFYWASFLGALRGKGGQALSAVNKALSINPEHMGARRLQSKLLIP